MTPGGLRLYPPASLSTPGVWGRSSKERPSASTVSLYGRGGCGAGLSRAEERGGLGWAGLAPAQWDGGVQAHAGAGAGPARESRPPAQSGTSRHEPGSARAGHTGGHTGGHTACPRPRRPGRNGRRDRRGGCELCRPRAALPGRPGLALGLAVLGDAPCPARPGPAALGPTPLLRRRSGRWSEVAPFPHRLVRPRRLKPLLSRFWRLGKAISSFGAVLVLPQKAGINSLCL